MNQVLNWVVCACAFVCVGWNLEYLISKYERKECPAYRIALQGVVLIILAVIYEV